jgi:hypothetical protein
VRLENLCVLAPRTDKYNCIAWSLGITNAWLWPTDPDLPVPLDEFDQYYAKRGYIVTVIVGPTSIMKNMVALLGYVWNGGSKSEMRHAQRFYLGELAAGATWTSKWGKEELISHRGSDLTSADSLYGFVWRFYQPKPGMDPELAARTAAEINAASRYREETTSEVCRRAGAVDVELRAEFVLRYSKWTQTWRQPSIAASSAPADRANSSEFRALVELGAPVVPLLMERLLDDSQFFALQAVQRLVDPALVFHPEPDDPAVLGGEQHRARETVRRWVRVEL